MFQVRLLKSSLFGGNMGQTADFRPAYCIYVQGETDACNLLRYAFGFLASRYRVNLEVVLPYSYHVAPPEAGPFVFGLKSSIGLH